MLQAVYRGVPTKDSPNTCATIPLCLLLLTFGWPAVNFCTPCSKFVSGLSLFVHRVQKMSRADVCFVRRVQNMSRALVFFVCARSESVSGRCPSVVNRVQNVSRQRPRIFHSAPRELRGQPSTAGWGRGGSGTLREACLRLRANFSAEEPTH